MNRENNFSNFWCKWNVTYMSDVLKICTLLDKYRENFLKEDNQNVLDTMRYKQLNNNNSINT